MFASFAVKVPMWPVHTWLPDAHVEAPTAGSVLLAGVLLKIGGYGYLRFSLPMLPEASAFFTPLIYTLSIVAIIYTSLVALVQEDMKKLIAYSSIAHMGFVTIGIFTPNARASTAASSRCSATASSRARCSCASAWSTTACTPARSTATAVWSIACRSMPWSSWCSSLASVGLPGTSGFVGEFLVLVGVFQVNTWVAAARRDRRVPRRRLHALALPPRVLRHARQGRLKAILDLRPRDASRSRRWSCSRC